MASLTRCSTGGRFLTSHFDAGLSSFLAACRFLFGDRPLAVRLVQAELGVLCVWLVYRLTAQFVARADGTERVRSWTPLGGGGLGGVPPYFILTSTLILTEAVFLPLMLFGPWALAVLWTGQRDLGTPSLGLGGWGRVGLGSRRPGAAVLGVVSSRERWRPG